MTTATSEDRRARDDPRLFNSALEMLVTRAFEHASCCGQVQCSPGHLLLALVEAPWGTAMIEQMGGDRAKLAKELGELAGLPPRLPQTRTGRARRYLQRKVFNTLRDRKVLLHPAALAGHDRSTSTTTLEQLRARAFVALRPAELERKAQVRPSAELSAVIEAVVVEVLGAEESNERTGGAIISRILALGDSPAAQALRSAGLGEPAGGPILEPDAAGAGVLAKFTSDLSAAASAGQLLPSIGRERELQAMLQILGRRDRNWVLLAGEPGTGKSAVVDALAETLAHGARARAGTRVLRVDFDALIAGGGSSDLDARLRRAQQELERVEDGIVVLDIDRVSSPANPRPTAMDLLPGRGRPSHLRFIAKMSHATYETLLRSPAAIDERFAPVTLAAMDAEAAAAVVQLRIGQYEQFHRVRYLPAARRHAVEVSEDVGGRRLPGSALDVLDHAGAMVKVAGAEDPPRVGPDDVDRALRSMTRGPELARAPASSSATEGDLVARLSARIRGQDRAVRRVCDAVLLHRAGLRTGERPIASFVFAGPSGVGKTELARQLAHELGLPLIRFDMSEYREQHSVARLIGAPPGYAGYDRGGLLTGAVRRNPHAVLLLDEIEKSNNDVYHLLLQIMDYGTLTDNAGCVAGFRDIILVMTSNVGVVDKGRSRRAVGFGSHDAMTRTERDAPFRREFPPEFINRLDGKIEFEPLGAEIVTQLVDDVIARLEARLHQRQVQLRVSDAARRYLARHGCDPDNGARPLQRLIDKSVLTPIAQELVFGRLARGGMVCVDEADDTLSIAVE